MIGGRRVIALILSGGGGTRLWPLSTQAVPKQFLRLFGQGSLYQSTLARVAAAAVDDIVVVSNLAHEQQVEAQARGIVEPRPMCVLEPMRRDSGPAIAAGVAAIMAGHGEQSIVTVLPCDHLIPDAAHFARSLSEAVELAQLGFLGTFGIRPTFPATEFGYIERAAPIAGQPNAFQVASFHEKPTYERASAYLADGAYDWNSGMFTFRADVFATEAERYMPKIWHAAVAAVRAGTRGERRLQLAADAFAKAPKMSIDYALFEKSERVGVVPVSFGWSDVGNWASVHEALAKDASGNATIGDVVTREASRNLVVGGDGVRVVLLGIDDLVVVATPEGVFVAPRHRAAEIKALIEDSK
jgi:mannose-1-phosphate guanylyltransferase/mannose-1-phosphate guanylyltransferase/mannose-6-phosphate isomerase